VLGRAAPQQLAQPGVLCVAPGVVGEQPLGDDAAVEEPVQRALAEGGDGGGALVVEHFGVGQSRAVVNDRVRVLVAGAVGAPAAVAGDRVPGLIEALQALGVHVQQLAGARPLVALNGTAQHPGTARAAAPLERAVHRRVRMTDLRGDQSWPSPCAP
jgi:hypothetical protein